MSCCKVIKTLQRFCLFLDKWGTIQSCASGIESQVDQHFVKKKKQASIRDFLNGNKWKKEIIVLNSEKDVSSVFRKNPNFTLISVNSNIR